MTKVFNDSALKKDKDCLVLYSLLCHQQLVMNTRKMNWAHLINANNSNKEHIMIAMN
jgi:hypothetical protein